MMLQETPSDIWDTYMFSILKHQFLKFKLLKEYMHFLVFHVFLPTYHKILS